MTSPLSALKSSPRPKSGPAAVLYDVLKAKGWRLSRRAWPTFVVFRPKDGRFGLVVARNSRSSRLRRHQRALLNVFAEHGIDCFTWSEDGGFEKLSSEPG